MCRQLRVAALILVVLVCGICIQAHQLTQKPGGQRIFRRGPVENDDKAFEKMGNKGGAALSKNGTSESDGFVSMRVKIKGKNPFGNLGRYKSAALKKLGRYRKVVDGIVVETEKDQELKDIKNELLNMRQQELNITYATLEEAYIGVRTALEMPLHIEHTGEHVDNLHVLSARMQNHQQELGKVFERMKGFSAIGEGDEPLDLYDGIMEHVGVAADKLEESLHDASDHFKAWQEKEGTTLETVVKLHGKNELETSAGKKGGSAETGGTGTGVKSGAKEPKPLAGRLIDSENNMYVLARISDATKHYEDEFLLEDIVLILALCFLCGLLFHKLKLPVFFGYLLCGILSGPSGYNLVQNIVQIETLGEIGVVFILFILGMEFSMDKIRRVLKPSFCVVVILLCGCVFGAIVVSILLGHGTSSSILFGQCMSLSSTAVILKSFDSEALQRDFGRQLLGILVFQDVVLGLLLAFLPVFKVFSTWSTLEIVLFGGKLSARLLLLFALAFFISRYAAGPYLRTVLRTHIPDELHILGVIAIMLLMYKVAGLLHLSVELGAFLGGLVVSSQMENNEELEVSIGRVRDIFSCFFFFSVGSHIYPSFLFREMYLLISVSIAVMFVKFSFTILCLRLGFRMSKNPAMLVAGGIAQVSEFAFVLASRAKSLSIITREMYYITIGVTSISLILHPLVYRLIFRRYNTEPSFNKPE
eukprot:Nk52_evm71s1444 gene=Nk52_evmTU71s1444